MEFPMHFIAATENYSTLTEHVPAPYFRGSFTLAAPLEAANLLITGLGFYEVTVNGTNITKGALAPYINNPNHLIYYDSYEIAPYLRTGNNVIGVCLGNGMLNSPGGYIWSFDKARYRSAPKMALCVTAGDTVLLESGTQFRTAPSPTLFDDLRNGEYYDARLELDGWAQPDYDDSGWGYAIDASRPAGDPLLCEAPPIVVSEEIAPLSVTHVGDGYLYDFGINTAGVCRLQIEGTAGQELVLYYGEYLIDGRLYRRNLCFDENDYVQKDIYICRGGGIETHTPHFTYKGFRYVFVKGMTPEQALPETLTALVMHSDLQEKGNFHCSDPVINNLQAITRRSDLANFFYFPTDCPHREKNGWTGDIVLSAEHMLLNLDGAASFRTWLHGVRKTQNEAGELPGIIPTDGWGFGNGPLWDGVIVYLPYFVYIYCGGKEILTENAPSMMRYLSFLTTRVEKDGLLHYGLGDWCQPDRIGTGYTTPVTITSTITAMDICDKAAFIFQQLEMPLQEQFARSFHDRLRRAIRESLLDLSTMTTVPCTQTAQAMAIYYNAFDEAEKPAAVEQLVNMIHAHNDLFDTGVAGVRVIFHVLSAFGYTDLALQMIKGPGFPSYGYWLSQGATSLWESFWSDEKNIASLNHHFWGDISGWFIRCLAGICYNPHGQDWHEVNIVPHFPRDMASAQGYYDAPAGKIAVSWKRAGDSIFLEIQLPAPMHGSLRLSDGYAFPDGSVEQPVASGEYTIIHS